MNRKISRSTEKYQKKKELKNPDRQNQREYSKQSVRNPKKIFGY